MNDWLSLRSFRLPIHVKFHKTLLRVTLTYRANATRLTRALPFNLENKLNLSDSPLRKDRMSQHKISNGILWYVSMYGFLRIFERDEDRPFYAKKCAIIALPSLKYY